MPVRIVIVEPHRWKAKSVFNTNAYPQNVGSVVDACSTRYALLLLHISSMHQVVQRDISDFMAQIESRRGEFEHALSSRPELTSIAIYDGLAHLSEMHSSLNMLKSFLDLYAKLVGKLIDPNNNWRFGKATVDGKKLSGGSIVNALRNYRRETLAALATLTLENSRTWITEAVHYRDQLSHWSDLDRMKQMQLPLRSVPPYFDFTELTRPAMPNGQDLNEYLDGLLHYLAVYIGESIRMLPGIDSNLISPERLR